MQGTSGCNQETPWKEHCHTKVAKQGARCFLLSLCGTYSPNYLLTAFHWLVRLFPAVCPLDGSLQLFSNGESLRLNQTSNSTWLASFLASFPIREDFLQLTSYTDQGQSTEVSNENSEGHFSLKLSVEMPLAQQCFVPHKQSRRQSKNLGKTCKLMMEAKAFWGRRLNFIFKPRGFC